MYSLIKVGNLAVALWGQPELSDVQRLIDELVVFGHELGRFPVFMSLVPTDGEPPNADTRKAMSRRFNDLLDVVDMDAMFAVFEGDGIRQRLNRTMIRTMLMVARLKRPVRIVHSLSEALDLAAAKLGPKKEAVIQAVDKARRVR